MSTAGLGTGEKPPERPQPSVRPPPGPSPLRGPRRATAPAHAHCSPRCGSRGTGGARAGGGRRRSPAPLRFPRAQLSRHCLGFSGRRSLAPRALTCPRPGGGERGCAGVGGRLPQPAHSPPPWPCVCAGGGGRAGIPGCGAAGSLAEEP